MGSYPKIRGEKARRLDHSNNCMAIVAGDYSASHFIGAAFPMPLDDPVGMLLNLTTRLCIGLGKLAGDGLNALFIGTARRVNTRPTHRGVSR
jgi:hypothetical protein